VDALKPYVIPFIWNIVRIQKYILPFFRSGKTKITIWLNWNVQLNIGIYIFLHAYPIVATQRRWLINYHLFTETEGNRAFCGLETAE
jgi:hypothetical protein